jgi:hypothetical protein
MREKFFDKRMIERRCIYHFESVSRSSILLNHKSFMEDFSLLFYPPFSYSCQLFFAFRNCFRSGKSMTACHEQYNRLINLNNSMNKLKKKSMNIFLLTLRFICHYFYFRFFLFFMSSGKFLFTEN